MSNQFDTPIDLFNILLIQHILPDYFAINFKTKHVDKHARTYDLWLVSSYMLI